MHAQALQQIGGTLTSFWSKYHNKLNATSSSLAANP
jgi:hypothetical protein